MNWGYAIAITIGAFMAFILTMVFKANMTETDLVAQDYYQQEVNYQGRINAIKNTNSIENKIEISSNREYVKIQLPTHLVDLNGKAHFYKSNNAEHDKVFQLAPGSNVQYLKTKGLQKGNYLLKLSFQTNGKDYYLEKDINIE